MANFKQPKKKKSVDYGDGFIASSPAIDKKPQEDIRKRFSKNYSPATRRAAQSSSTQDIAEVRSQEEGFPISNTVNVGSMDMPTVGSLDEAFEDEPKKKRFGFIHKRTSTSPRKKLVRSFGIMMAALLFGVGSLFAYAFLKANNIFNGNGEGAVALQDNIDPTQLNGEGDGRVNILLLGKGGPGHEAPDLTDTLLLASIDPVANEAALLSIPRDMYVQDQNGNGTKINAVYSNAKQYAAYTGTTDEEQIENAGLRAIKKTVSDIVGIPVHYYIMVNFDAFEQAIDTVGGITVDVKEPLYDQSVAWLLGGNPLVADQGLQTFDGERALLYSRSRKGSARGDFDRTERQREVIIALQQKVLSLGTFSNPLKVIELLETFGNNVRTDLNGLGEVKRLYEIGRQIGSDKIISVGLADPPNVLVGTDFVGNQSVVLPIEGQYQYDEIQSYIRNTLRDPFLKQENARIVILNGTETTGLASLKEKELKSYGYNVVSIGDAPVGTYVNSTLYKVTSEDKPFTQNYLERRIGLQVSQSLIEGLPTSETTDFVIILGDDEVIETTSN